MACRVMGSLGVRVLGHKLVTETRTATDDSTRLKMTNIHQCDVARLMMHISEHFRCIELVQWHSW